MQLDVDTAAVEGVADAVHRAATAVGAVPLPPGPPCEDVGAADATAALLAVSAERLRACQEDLGRVALLVDTAARDYARAEARAAGRLG